MALARHLHIITLAEVLPSPRHHQTAAWHLQSWSIITPRPAFSPQYCFGIRTPPSSRHISEIPAARYHEGGISSCLVMRLQRVPRYSQQSEYVCVCLSKSQKGPLMALYKLIAKWLKSLDCYLCASRQEALCHSSVKHVSLPPTNHMAIQTAIARSERENMNSIYHITHHYPDAYGTLVRKNPQLT